MEKKITSKIPWREKIDRITEFKVIDIPIRMRKRFGKGKMLIPRPSDLEDLIKKIRKGKLVTKSELRNRLSADFNADVTCPITAGIFLRIIAEAAEEESQNGKKAITPYWRVINNDGSLNVKLPGGEKHQAEYLKKEGHKIGKSAKGNRLIVKDFKKNQLPYEVHLFTQAHSEGLFF